MKHLDCQSNQILSLDLTSSSDLISLYCQYNFELASLDLASNTSLNSLNCSGCNLSCLDISNNHLLDSLLCDGNSMEQLNLQNGNYNLFIDANYNALTCVEVFDVEYANEFWWSYFIPQAYSETVNFSSNCNYGNDCVTVSIQEQGFINKELINVVDALGREVNHTPNQILFYIYDDGSVEKKFIVE